MSGHEPKRHHFVQRAYLDGFTDPRSNRIWRYIVGKVPAISGTEEVAVQNYYYCHEENGERKYLDACSRANRNQANLPLAVARSSR
jgi:hypothetical protein